jgi:hypothetical protein
MSEENDLEDLMSDEVEAEIPAGGIRKVAALSIPMVPLSIVEQELLGLMYAETSTFEIEFEGGGVQAKSVSDEVRAHQYARRSYWWARISLARSLGENGTWDQFNAVEKEEGLEHE